MKKNLLTILLPALLAAAPILAQTTVKDALIKHWKVTGEFTLAVAKTMPADSYDFCPNPEEMSFGQLIAHIAGADMQACAIATGQKAPAMPAKIMALRNDPKTEIDRDLAVDFATDAFAFCNQAITGMAAGQLDKVVGPANRQMTGFEWLWAYFTHTAHHRGQAEVYLRVKGIKPPEYVF